MNHYDLKQSNFLTASNCSRSPRNMKLLSVVFQSFLNYSPILKTIADTIPENTADTLNDTIAETIADIIPKTIPDIKI